MKSQDQTSDYQIGVTCVRVMRKDIQEQTKKETIREVHNGIVVGKTNSFLRVFNPAPVDKGGDISPEMAQLFPVSSARMWCETTMQRKEAYPIPLSMQ